MTRRYSLYIVTLRKIKTVGFMKYAWSSIIPNRKVALTCVMNGIENGILQMLLSHYLTVL